MLKRQFLPAAVGIFSHRVLRPIPHAMELVGAALQSKRGGGFDAEWQEIENAVRFIRRERPVIFDVGANIGNWTEGLVRRLKSRDVEGRIYMFEPQPQCWTRLAALDLAGVALVKHAVGDADGMIAFYQGSNSEVASAYERSDFAGVTEKIEVPSLILDDFIADERLEYVDYIKMDIEGHEFKAALGAKKSLQAKMIGAISFEFGPANVNSRVFFLDLYTYFMDLGMTIYRMGHDGLPVRLPEYSRDLEYFSGVANYVASFDAPKKFRI